MGWKKKKKSLKKSLKKKKEKKEKKEKKCGGIVTLPASKLQESGFASYFPDEKICGDENGYIKVRYKSKCDGEEDPDSSLDEKLEICEAEKTALQNEITAKEDELRNLKEEISTYVPVDTVNSIMNDKFCTPYSQLEGNFIDVKDELNKCQTAYNSRTDQLNKVYERYKDDVKKYHETIKTIIDSGDTSVIKEEKQQIYKEESLMLQEKIRKNWRKLYIVLVILIVVMVLCILKFFDFI